MADNKLEIEIIDDGDGGTRSLSPDDFSSIREFNKALARLKAEVRAQEFEASKEVKARREKLRNDKVALDEQKQAHKTQVEQTRLEINDRKVKRQLDVVIQQEERARDNAKNKQDRHREMMLRHILGAINPNSTFQYRASSIYGLLNTSGITSRLAGQQDGDDQQTTNKTNDVLDVLSNGLKNLFGQTGAFIRSLFGSPTVRKQAAVVNQSTSNVKNQISSIISSPPENDGGDDEPWWFNLKRKSAGDTNSLRAINSKLLPGPKNNIPGLPFAKPANIKMAVVQGGGGNQPPVAGGGNNVFNPGGPPAPPAGGSPAGGAGGGFGGMAGKLIGGVVSNLGSIAVTGAMVAGVFGVLGVATKLLSWRFQSAADDMRMWSGALIGASINRQMQMMSFNIERANKYGEGLAGFEQSRTNVEIAMTKLGDSLTMAFLPLMEVINNVITSISNKITSILDLLGRLNPMNWFFDTPEQKSQFHNFIYNAMILTPELRDWLYSSRTKNSNAMRDIAANLANFLNMPVNPQTAVARGTGSVYPSFILPSNNF